MISEQLCSALLFQKPGGQALLQSHKMSLLGCWQWPAKTRPVCQMFGPHWEKAWPAGWENCLCLLVHDSHRLCPLWLSAGSKMLPGQSSLAKESLTSTQATVKPLQASYFPEWQWSIVSLAAPAAGREKHGVYTQWCSKSLSSKMAAPEELRNNNDFLRTNSSLSRYTHSDPMKQQFWNSLNLWFFVIPNVMYRICQQNTRFACAKQL